MRSKSAPLWTLILLAVILAGCLPASALPPATETATSSPVPTETPAPTFTPTDTLPPTPTRTPPNLPGPYQTSFLYDGDTPHTYIADTCQYLRDRWTSTNAAPGTVVMVIMFHAIGGDTYGDRISEADFHILMQALYDNGFQAINMTQLAGFMESNTTIPNRSVLLLVDDRKTGEYFDTFFRPYWQSWGWPVVNAWINLDDSIGRSALPANVALENEGWVDHQSHGVVHNIPMGPDSSEEYIFSELQGSMTLMQQNYGKTPIAIIWPGGGFTQRPVEVARQVGYRLGFTINPRGPLMYNWVPLADEKDPRRPSWIPDGGMNDPLLVLPRYWDSDAINHIVEVLQIGQEAAAYAEANKTVELDYYDIVCFPTYGPLP
jgi:hypothetical protein